MLKFDDMMSDDWVEMSWLTLSDFGLLARQNQAGLVLQESGVGGCTKRERNVAQDGGGALSGQMFCVKVYDLIYQDLRRIMRQENDSFPGDLR
jgi:hypothetical protein